MGQPKLRRPKRIAPRLADGASRDTFGGRLPAHIKQGLRMRAFAENKSISWFMEEWIIETFRFRKPEYIAPKKPTTEERSEARGTKRRKTA